jgi:hypothetical protein
VCGYDLRRLKVELPACIGGCRWFLSRLKLEQLVCDKVESCPIVLGITIGASAAPGTSGYD